MPKTRASHSFWSKWSKAGIDVCVGGRGAAVFGAEKKATVTFFRMQDECSCMMTTYMALLQ